MPKVSFESRLSQKRKEYADKYDISDLTTGNDKDNLETLLRNSIIIETLQAKYQELAEGDIVANLGQITDLEKTLKSIIASNLALEKALGLDRAARKKEDSVDSPAEYVAQLKLHAKEFLEKRITKVFCPDCKVMIFRFSPVQDHTKFEIKCTCSQCKKVVRVHREEKDILFDLPAKDREWRKKYPYAVELPKVTAVDEVDTEDDELRIGGE